MHTDLGQHDEAAAVYAEHLALAKARSDARPDDPSRTRTLAMAHAYVADAQFDGGVFEDAMVSYKAKAPGPAWISREADLLWGRSRTERAMGDRAAAQRSLAESLAGYQQLAQQATLTAMETAMLAQVEKDLAELAAAP